jgi:hypothetical protein
MAAMVKVGFAPPPVGKIEEPAMQRASMPGTRASAFTTPSAGCLPTQMVPTWRFALINHFEAGQHR